MNVNSKNELVIPKHLAENLDAYSVTIESQDDIDDFMFDIYATYEFESYASYDVIKAYLNPLTRKFVGIEEESER